MRQLPERPLSAYEYSRVINEYVLYFFSKQEYRQDSADALYRYIEAGWLKPFVGKIYKLDEAPQSHVDMTSRKGAMGKDVISIEK